jgi:hypothetical protein
MGRAEEIFEHLRTEGESAVAAYIEDFQSENLWLDFKRSADDANGKRLNVNDRENLARAISGFGNADGGVIVWGVDCRRDPKTGADLPSGRMPLTNPSRFVSWLENAVSGCTAPPHRSVEHIALPTGASSAGYVATLIPSSLESPLQCIQPPDRLQYYMRAGSSFSAIPHAVLAGLFGRRPEPRVAQKWFGPSVGTRPPDGVSAFVAVALSSTGRAIARDLYLNVYCYPPGPHSQVEFLQFAAERQNWERHEVAANFSNVISRESLRLAPGAALAVGAVSLELKPPFERSLIVEMAFGCEGSERRQWRQETPPHVIGDACAQLNASTMNGNQFLQLVLGTVGYD